MFSPKTTSSSAPLLIEVFARRVPVAVMLLFVRRLSNVLENFVEKIRFAGSEPGAADGSRAESSPYGAVTPQGRQYLLYCVSAPLANSKEPAGETAAAAEGRRLAERVERSFDHQLFVCLCLSVSVYLSVSLSLSLSVSLCLSLCLSASLSL